MENGKWKMENEKCIIQNAKCNILNDNTRIDDNSTIDFTFLLKKTTAPQTLRSRLFNYG